MKDIKKDPFEEYIKNLPPTRKELGQAWQAAIGLQDVAEHSWYFRNALIRANYNNIKNGIYETTDFLEKFMRNFLLNEKHELHNREKHISGKFLLGHDNSINDPIKLDERELQIIELLREESSLTRKEMAARLEMSGNHSGLYAIALQTSSRETSSLHSMRSSLCT